MLYIVATPIGNLKDITLRALEILNSVDGVIVEDSRKTAILLQSYQISKPIIVLNDYNEASTLKSLLPRLITGENFALLSDAGTPLISDPGYKLVRECLKEGIEVDSLPGAVSPIVALTLSSLPPDKFIFLGYLPEKPGKRREQIEKIKEISQILPATFICFIPPHKLVKTLEELKTILGNIPVCLAKELTKIHQKVKMEPLEEWLAEFSSSSPKGEFVLLFNLKSAE